jgi:alpha-tubulin suppressor-like RCC1 family protein
MYQNESIKSMCVIDIINSSNESELIMSINNATKQVISKGIVFSKSEIIKYCREKKASSLNIWTKQVARNLGALLKQIKRYKKLCELRETDISSESELRCFGTFYDNEKYQNANFKISFSQISCGGSHLVGLSDGNIYTWGKNIYGQLGNNSLNKEMIPTIINIPSCKYISAGFSTSSFITTDGKIYSCGATDNGRLGIEGVLEKTCMIPTKVKHDFIATKICSGSTNQIALSDDHHIYTWGSKYYCGMDTNVDILYPTKILEDTKFYNISLGIGGYHMMVESLAGYLYTWGHNEMRQLGFDIGKGTSQNEFKEPCCQLPTLVESAKDLYIKSISAGWGNSAFVSYDGKAYICGRNVRGQVGVDPGSCKINELNVAYVEKFTCLNSLSHENIEKVVCGGEHCAAITKDGKLYLWGDNSYNQLCSDTPGYTYTPKMVNGPSKVLNVSLGTSSTFIQNEKIEK